MLTIRVKQMDLIRESVHDRFIDEMTAYLLTQYEKDWDEVRMRELVREGMEKAARYGITDGRDILRFLGFLLAAGFDPDEIEEHRWTKDLLGDPALDGDEKISLLYRHLPVLSR